MHESLHSLIVKLSSSLMGQANPLIIPRFLWRRGASGLATNLQNILTRHLTLSLVIKLNPRITQ